jgi:hypothetical protein
VKNTGMYLMILSLIMYLLLTDASDGTDFWPRMLLRCLRIGCLILTFTGVQLLTDGLKTDFLTEIRQSK